MIFLLGLGIILILFLRWQKREKSVAFFHPYCDAGGGGERVLWEAVSAVHKNHPDFKIFVFSGDQVEQERILERAQSRFNLKVPPVEIVRLNWRKMVEASTWPYFTLAGQSFGSIILALEAVLKLNPEIMIDSIGYSFTYPLFRLAGCRVGCYIHYPTISTDMLEKVQSRRADFNNSATIAKNPILSYGKLVYYRLFAWLYGICGRRSSAVMTNSSWTKSHLDSLWGVNTSKIFPPCDVSKFTTLPRTEKRVPGRIISLAQFRPEKNHVMQIDAFYHLKNKIENENLHLIMAGGVRNEGDEKRASELEAKIAKLGLEKEIFIERNVSFERILELFETAEVGIHTMRDEHFGITCVDFQASGVIPVGHNSAGPKMDILVPHEERPTGFLAETAVDFAQKMEKIFALKSQERIKIQNDMSASCRRFSAEQFQSDFSEATKNLFSS